MTAPSVGRWRLTRAVRREERRRYEAEKIDYLEGRTGDASEGARSSAVLPFVPPDLNAVRYFRNRRA